MAFVKAIKTETPPPVTGEDGVASLAIAIQCLDGRPPGEVAMEPALNIKAARASRRAFFGKS
jgi:hypothetical protein